MTETQVLDHPLVHGKFRLSSFFSPTLLVYKLTVSYLTKIGCGLNFKAIPELSLLKIWQLFCSFIVKCLCIKLREEKLLNKDNARAHKLEMNMDIAAVFQRLIHLPSLKIKCFCQFFFINFYNGRIFKSNNVKQILCFHWKIIAIVELLQKWM